MDSLEFDMFTIHTHLSTHNYKTAMAYIRALNKKLDKCYIDTCVGNSKTAEQYILNGHTIQSFVDYSNARI